jgi:FAD/FMN-containing dehydrogenase
MKLPARLEDNWVSNDPVRSYAEYWPYPKTEDEVRGHVELAFQARTNKASLVDNTRTLRKANSTCPA